MKYLKLFEKDAEYQAFIGGSNVDLPNVSFAIDTAKVYYNPTSDNTDTKEYLTIEALEDNLTASLSVNACEYCVDGDGDWKTLNANTPTESINVGQTLSFRGNLIPAFDLESGIFGIGTFTISKKCNVLGNVMSMLFGDDAQDKLSLADKSCAFYGLFSYCSNIISAKDLKLPATTLADYCYSCMFVGCTSLVTAPTIPLATELTEGCYDSMFYECESLTTAPELLATTLTNNCYGHMFYGCTSLTTAPKLPATTLADYCYDEMFYGCTRLTTAPELPATELTERCYYNMFYGCTSLTTAPTILPAATLTNNCYSQMFMNCTSLTIAPALPATELTEGCYSNMFCGCTSLTTAPELPATTLAYVCYLQMFMNCTSLVTAPELPATTLADNCYIQMFMNCSKLNYIKMLATDMPSSNCLSHWVNGVASTGTFIKHPDMTSLSTSAHGIPEGWTVQDAA